MEIVKSNGIVLSGSRSGESDCVSRIFTKEHGKRGFVFKGLKKSKKRSMVAAEPGTAVHLLYYYHEDRDYHIVNEFRINRHTFDIRKELDRILHLCLLLESVDKTTGYNDPNRRIYDLLYNGLNTLALTDYPANLSLFFMIHLLRIHGILPDLGRCGVCGSQSLAGSVLEFGSLLPLCRKCMNTNEGRRVDGISSSSWEYLSLVITHKFASVDHSAIDPDSVLDLLFQVCIFIETYFHIELKSKGLLSSAK